MTTAHIDTSAWPQSAEIGLSETQTAGKKPSWAVAVVGLGALLNIGWIGLLGFVAAKLTFL